MEDKSGIGLAIRASGQIAFGQNGGKKKGSHLTSIGFLSKIGFVISDFVKANVMTPQVEMVKTARVYCDLIDHLDGANPVWLEQLTKLLPRLHAAIAELDQSPCGNATCCLTQDLDDRFEIFSRLHCLLGERDSYWMEFNL